MRTQTTARIEKDQSVAGTIMEYIGLASLGFIDIAITGTFWARVSMLEFDVLGKKINSSVTGFILAIGFWYAGYFIVRTLGPVVAEVTAGKGSFSNRMKAATKDFRVVIGLVAAGFLWFGDMISDSLSAVFMVYPETTVFTLSSNLVDGPGAMYFMMVLMGAITTLGEPIIYARILWKEMGKQETKSAVSDKPDIPRVAYSSRRSKTGQRGYLNKSMTAPGGAEGARLRREAGGQASFK